MKSGKIYSFDLFETIINRIVDTPEKIFELMVSEAKKKGIIISGDFAKRRVYAEKIISKKKRNYNIFDIYSNISEKGVSTEKLIELELETEIKYAVVNKKVKNRIDQLSTNGDEVCIISDMYWPSNYLDEYLKHFEIEGYKNIFCSCDCDSNKYDGSLFKHVVKELDIHPFQLIHVGDNWRSDYIVPRILGINAQLYTIKHEYNELYLEDTSKSIGISSDDSKLICCLCDKSASRAYQLGYCLFGPILYGFSRWLEEKRQAYAQKKMFFLSRDGLIIKKAYKILYPDIETRYFYASRKALLVPMLHYYDSYKEVKKCFFASGKETNSEILDKLGINYMDYKDTIKKYCELHEPVNDSFDCLFDELKNIIDSNSIEQERLLNKYISMQGVKDDSIIVDIGWFGNMQYSLEKVLNGNKGMMKGLYLGVVPYSHRVVDGQVDAEGYLFGYGDKKNYQVVKSAIAFFEFFFTADHGTVEGYYEDDEIKPILGEAELQVTKDVDESFIHSEMQRGALRYVEDKKKFFGLEMHDFSGDKAIANIVRFINRPHFADIELIKNIVVSRSDNMERKMLVVRGVLYYCFHVKDFIYDFKQAGIKTFFLKYIFRIDIPYLDFYLFIRRLFGKGKN